MVSAFWTWTLVIAAGWVAATTIWHFVVLRWVRGQVNGDLAVVATWWFNRLYTKLVHRVQFEGQEHVPQAGIPGPLLVVANHTCAVDPLLIQAGAPFRIKWMMAGDMIAPALAPILNNVAGVIPVARDGKDLGPAREAIRQIRDGNVVGIFPEGRIVFPSNEIWPFFNGVGLIVARAKARVLVVWVRDTPCLPGMVQSLTTRSHSKVTYLDLIDFDGEKDAEKITAVLKDRIEKASGWPTNDDPPKLGEIDFGPDRFGWFRHVDR